MDEPEQVDPALLEEEAAGEPDEEVEVVVRLNDGPPPPGLRIISRLGPVATGRVRRGELLRVHAEETVHSLKASRSFGPPGSPADELALEADGPDIEGDFDQEDLVPRHPRNDPARGVGTVAAFCDWGPDIAHPDTRLPGGGTRFLAIWDQRGRAGSAPGIGENRFGYGRIYDRDAINRALASDDPYHTLGLHPGFNAPGGNSHGTHTLSIAAGTPGDGRPGGVAPGADLIFVNLADHSHGEGINLGNSVTLCEAVDFCLETAAGLPMVCNFSMGRTADAHAGLSLLERAFDALLLSRDGLAFVNSGGNYHRARLHAATWLTPGARYDAVWELESTRGGPHLLEAWYPWRDTLRFELRSPDGSLVADVPLRGRAEVRRDGRLWAHIYHRHRDPNQPLNQIAVYVYDGAPAGTWTVTLVAEDIVDGRCNLWIDRTGIAGAQSRFRAEDAVPTSTTGSICNGFHTIAVGAYDTHTADHHLGSFSSGGPTGDGRIVPHLVAPGVRVVAARSAPLTPTTEPSLLAAKSGTSEAAPHITGLIACMYEVAGSLPIRQVRQLLLRNTEPPPPAAQGEEYRWGLGYLDVDRVLAATRAFTRSQRPPGESSEDWTAGDPQPDFGVTQAIPGFALPGRAASLTSFSAESPPRLPLDMPVDRPSIRRRFPMENEFPDQGLRRPDEQEDIPGPTVWTVQVGQAWIRSGPPDFRRRDTQLIPRGTRLIVLETQDAYAHVATTGQAEIGWTAQSNLTAYYSQQPDLLSTRLAPNQPITVEASWPAERRDLARTYNRLGGLLTALAARARLEVPGILAVWQVESGGSQHQPGQAIIRFENHLLWRSWGQYDPERFDASFQFGGRPPMTDPVRCAAPFRCHRYRPAATRTDPAPAWRSVHASQADEYAALRLAQGLAGDEPALTSISIGGPQILVANYSRLGYDSAREMYDAFQASEIAHVLGFADFCEHDGAGGATLQHLRDHDWSGFARRYNGPGQVASYATRLEAAYAEAAQLFHTGRTPATERAEPDAGEEPGLQERETAAIGGLAESGVARDRDLTDQTLSATIQDADLGRLFTARDPVVSGQPIQLGKGVTIDVIGAPRDTLATSPQAGDLLVRLVPGDRPVVAVLDNAQLRDSTAAAATGVPIELLLPGRYATVRQEGQSRLRRLVDAEGRVPVGQAVVRLNPPVEDQPERVPGPSPTRNSTWEAPASQDAPDHPSQIELQVGETFTLDLPSLMSAGYTWGHELLGPPGIIDLSWSAFSPASQPLGRGTERATVRALAPGQVTVRLVQHRSWERDKGPLSRRTIQITVRSTAADATAEAVSYRSAPAGAEHAAQPGEPVADRAGETVLQDANITPIPADTGIAYESTDTSWRPWTDLIVHQVPRPIVADLAKRGISIPQLKDAYGDINLDCYAVKISRMPFLHGNQLAPETLLAHIRRNFDAFVDTNNSSFPPLDNSIDKPRWESDSPLGAVINIHIHVLGTIDQGLVVCSRAEPRLWVFTTAHGGPAGYHPVTGNRMFGIRADGNEWVLFTRGADRATQFIDWVGNVVGSIWSGADALWRSFQAKVKDFISVNHGSAVVIQPKSERWSWEPIEYRLYRAHGEEVSSREQEEADGQAIWPSSLPTPR